MAERQQDDLAPTVSGSRMTRAPADPARPDAERPASASGSRARRSKGMGRGLAAILSAVPKEESEELRELPLELIVPNPSQPRRAFEEGALLALAESIRAQGVLQPVLVRPLASGRYELIAGERRWRAAKLAEREAIPAIVRRGTDAATLELALIENMARQDLNPVEAARACVALTEELGLTREEVGLRVGRSRVAVSNLIRLLELPDEALELVQQGELSEGHGRALLLSEDHADRRDLARAAARGQWSVRELERRARTHGADHAGTITRARAKRALHPDQEAAIQRIEDALAPVLGREVEVTPTRGSGFKVQLTVSSEEDALELARGLRIRPAA